MIPAILAGAGFLLEAAGAVGEHQAQKKRQRENARAAREARVRGMADLSIRQVQENRASGFEQDRTRRRTQEASGLARVSAAESGVTGMAVDVLLGDLEGEAGQALRIIEENQLMTDLQIGRQREAVVAQEQARRNSVARPNPWATGLTIGASAIRSIRPFTDDPPGV